MAAPDAGVVFVIGPTASGKTDIAIELARAFDAEIIGADSRQIYRGMPVGTAAPAAEQLAAARHHLVGFVDPCERYSAARYVRDAAAAIADIRSRGKRVIIAGGTGFYVRALAGDVDLAAAPEGAVRDRLVREARLHSPQTLAAWLRVLDPQRADAVEANDTYRVIRALEIALTRRSEEPPRDQPLPTLRTRGIPFRKLYVELERAQLHARIERRTDEMLAAGFVAEAERIGAAAVAADAVGYREALAFGSGWMSADELRARLARNTRRYAKRQVTWFRSEPGVVRLAGGNAALWPAAARETPGWA